VRILKRKPRKAITLFLIVFLLGVLSSGAIFVRHAIYQTEVNLRAQLPAVATLEWAELPDWEFLTPDHLEENMQVFELLNPTTDMVEGIGSLTYVKDYDFRK